MNPALQDISFELAAGRIVALVGESGSGKSVTASSIMGLLPPLARIESGEVRLKSNSGTIDLCRLAPHGKVMSSVRGGVIGMIFQDPMMALNPVFSIGTQLTEVIKLHTKLRGETARKRAVKILSDVGLPAPELQFKEYPHQFSGGMRQRVVIAMAIACEPRVLIADEPTTALDVTVQSQILTLIQSLAKSNNMATILITHDMAVVSEVADDVLVMYMGKIVERGTVRDVLDNPQHPYTQALIRAIPVLGRGSYQTLEPIPGSAPDPYERPRGCQFAPRCPIARDICRVDPPVVEVSPGHTMACWKLTFPDTSPGKDRRK